jgi:hypothetical protein
MLWIRWAFIAANVVYSLLCFFTELLCFFTVALHPSGLHL